MENYLIGETPELLETLDTGDTVTVSIYDKNDGSSIDLDTNSATEIGTTGLYRYTADFTNPPISGSNQYVAIFTGTLQAKAKEFNWSSSLASSANQDIIISDLDDILAIVDASTVTAKNVRICQVVYNDTDYDVAIGVSSLDEINNVITQWALDKFGIVSGGEIVLNPPLDLPAALIYTKTLSDVITTLDLDDYIYEIEV